MVTTTLFRRMVTLLAALLVGLHTTAAVPIEAVHPPSSNYTISNSTSTSTGSTTNHTLSKRYPHMYCKNFPAAEDRTSEKSPLWKDCVQIYKNVEEKGAIYGFMNKIKEGSTKLDWFGSCVFGVHVHKKGQGHMLGTWAQAGDQDLLRALIQTENMAIHHWWKGDDRLEKGIFESLEGLPVNRRIKDTTRIGARGNMDCSKAVFDTHNTLWSEWGFWNSADD